MTLPITKRVTLDTNQDIFGEELNFFIEVINESDGTHTNEFPIFTEIQLNETPTGIYITDLVFTTLGHFTIIIKHLTLEKEGLTRVIISEESEYVDLENKVVELSLDTEATEGESFA